MPTVCPFRGYVVAPDRVWDVVAPAYDALTPTQRHRYAQAHPDNYVNAMRSLEEYPESERPPLEALLERNKRNLEKLLEQGAFRDTGVACLFVYRLSVEDHEQVGVVGEVPVDEYDRGLIKRHEHTQTNRENHLARYNDVVGASSSPVCLTYTHHPRVNALVDEVMRSTPVIDFTAEDGVAQTIWRIDDPDTLSSLRDCFAEVGEAYLTDGHHRAAAASTFAQWRRERDGGDSGDEPYNYMLVVLFPDDQVRILAYNRYVRDLNGQSVAGFLAALPDDFMVERLGDIPPSRAQPAAPREFSMLLDGDWYRLKIDSRSVPGDPVGSLDIALLHDRILGPVLGIADVRCDERCESIAGAVGTEGLAERCREGGGVGFACHPMSIQELMAVADANLVMPPKSTWFDPKVRSGLFLRLRN